MALDLRWAGCSPPRRLWIAAASLAAVAGIGPGLLDTGPGLLDTARRSTWEARVEERTPFLTRF